MGLKTMFLHDLQTCLSPKQSFS